MINHAVCYFPMLTLLKYTRLLNLLLCQMDTPLGSIILRISINTSLENIDRYTLHDL